MDIIITRSVADAQETKTSFSIPGLSPRIIPFIELTSLTDGIKRAQELIQHSSYSLLFTSTHAARLCHSLLSPGLTTPCYCSGDKAALFLTGLGYSDVHSAHKDSLALVEYMIKHAITYAGTEKLLYLCARDVSHDIVSLLGDQGFNVSSVALYETTHKNYLSPQELAYLTSPCSKIILFYSASAATAFVEIVNHYHLKTALHTLTAVTISDIVGNILKSIPFSDILIADLPNEESLLRTVTLFLNKNQRDT
ncbi:MAG: uroporphyrinogen-III synthase [Alphaproteobacteria bacterium]|nr:uroporphyrinogen-III synthase [Alphaproteobacteria bacterium]